MAEFQEVCKQWRRMCVHGSEGFACAHCNMYSSIDESVCRGIPDEDEAKIIESFVMSWAAEHPEPVYPTWLEWLKSMGVIPYMMGLVTVRDVDGTFGDGHVNITENALKEIPADIAEKLGIEPKEG